MSRHKALREEGGWGGEDTPGSCSHLGAHSPGTTSSKSQEEKLCWRQPR